MWNWSWRTLVLLAAGGLILAAFLVPDPTAQDLSSLSTRELVQLLTHPRDAVREAASGQLTARAKTVMPELLSAIDRALPEQIEEIIAILEELMLSSDRQVAESAETALEQITDSGHPLAVELSSKVLGRNAMLRHARAMIRIGELGGTVRIVNGNESTLSNQNDDPMVSAIPSTRFVTRIVLIDHNWKGGDADWKYFSRLFPGEDLSLHVAEDTPMSEATLRQILVKRPGTMLRLATQGCMGLSYYDSTEALISSVMPGSPADRAGLRAGDVITKLNGTPIFKVYVLARWAREHHPGDMVELTVRRRNSTLRTRFTLGSDFGTGKCRCGTSE